MKKYFFETPVTQLDRSAEHDYLFCAPARVWVCAESETEAFELAAKKIHAQWDETGRALLSDLTLTKVCDLPVDWSYGYHGDRVSGTTDPEAVNRIVAAAVIR